MKGFTLIEITIYIAVSSLILLSIITLAWSMSSIESNTHTIIEQEIEDLYSKRLEYL